MSIGPPVCFVLSFLILFYTTHVVLLLQTVVVTLAYARLAHLAANVCDRKRVLNLERATAME